MRNLIEWYLDLDRRWIYLLVFLAVLIPVILYQYFTPIGLPLQVRGEVTPVFEKIENMEPGSDLLISQDYSPSSEPELFPMSKALLKHAFRNKLDVYIVTLWPTAPGLVIEALREVRSELKREGIEVEPGEDYVFFGYKPGNFAVILGMGESIKKNFPRTYRGRNVANLQIMQDVSDLTDMEYSIILAAGETVNTWLIYGSERYGFPMGIGVTGVIAPEFYPYLRANQVNGILGGLRGAAEYEKLLNYGRSQQIVDAAQRAPSGSDKVAHFSIEDAYQILNLELDSVIQLAEANPQISSSEVQSAREYKQGLEDRIENNNLTLSYLKEAKPKVNGALGYYSQQKGRAIAGMDAQSIVHLLIVIAVILANLAYFGRNYYERREA